jgi:pimeloyl-ACP methyl ester carboxylesterase
MSENNTSKTLYAIIIGINKYPRTPLYGCVNDALDVHEFCRQLTEANESITEYKPKLLLAPHADDLSTLSAHHIGKDDYESPTRANVIRAFSHFKQADPDKGDICLLYYSGHGSFQPAPQLFWELKSERQVETMVCVDSREPGGRDLIDKELAYLLWDAVHDKTTYEEGKPSVHTLLIYDCCHSGDNMRGESPVRNRMETPNSNHTPIEEYSGYQEIVSKGSAVEAEKRFLKALDAWRSVRYVHLAAARDTETAKETQLENRQSGVFTYSLLNTLRNGGMGLSYKELMERVKVMVRNRVSEQIPLVFATKVEDERFTIMGGGLKEPSRKYPLSYKKDVGWKMAAGANVGIVEATDEDSPVIVKVWRDDRADETREVKVLKVGATESTLDDSAFTEEDEQHADKFSATVVQMDFPRIKLYVVDEVTQAAREKLMAEAGKITLPNFEFTDAPDEGMYYVYHRGGKYILAKKASNVPVFERTADANGFIKAVQRVGDWLRVLEMNNKDTEIERDAVQVEVEIIEGKEFTEDNVNTVEPTSTLTDPAEIKVSFKPSSDPEAPYFPGLRVKLKATNRNYFMSSLYLDSKYGIVCNLETTEIKTDGGGQWLSTRDEGTVYNTLLLDLDDKYHKLGITEITDYLKIFVSKEPFPVEGWAQESLTLDDELIEPATRGQKGLRARLSKKNPADWTCFTIPIHIKRPLDQQEQPVGEGGKKTADFPSFSVQVPSGFSGKVSAATPAEIRQIVNEVSTRSADDAATLRKTLLPPAILWGGTPSSHAVFSRSVSAGEPDAQLSVVELTGVKGADAINADNPLLLKTNGGVEEDEALISFGYDPESGLYLPVGISDGDGNVRIEQLPEETAGKIVDKKSINERSIGGSIKLFFKKVVLGRLTGENPNVLALCELENEISVAKPVAAGALADKNNICLLIHGIIGDTEGQRKSFFEKESKLYQQFDAVITYDYENLNTPIEDTAKQLKADLAKAGVTEDGGKRLTIVAHSMGGLVSRWFIEQEGGSAVVSRLIQCGTPNGGSETSDFRKSVFSMLGVAMNGAVFMQPYLPALSFIGKQVNKALFNTLNQMSPSSEFLQKLNVEGGPHPEVDYWVIGGNTGDIEPEKIEGAPMLKQFWSAVLTKVPHLLLNKFVFKSEDPNDIAVTQVSMKTVPSQDTLPFYNVACDHLSYFDFEASMQKLQEIIEGRVQ